MKTMTLRHAIAGGFGGKKSAGASRRPALLLLLVAAVLVGPPNAQAQDQAPRGEVVIFRGIVGYWPRVERFQQQLWQHGFSSRVVFNVQRGSVSEQLRRQITQGEAGGPAVIVGYSLGAMNAIGLARDLQEVNVRVPMLVLIDPPVVGDIPSNVGRCLNVYKSHPVTDLVPEQVPIMRGIPVRRWSPRTEVVNVNLSTKDLLFGPFYDNHLTIASTDEMQDRIAETISVALSPPDDVKR